MGCTNSPEVKEKNGPIIEQEKKVNEKNEEKVEEQQNQNLKTEKEIDQLTFNKELCKSLAKGLPTRTQIELQALKVQMKSNTNKLSQKEKSYIIFLWICENIAYDAKSYFAGRDVDCTPEGVYRNGSTVCSGYSRLYKDISTYLDLQVECVSCYAKGVGYEPGKRLNQTDHEYNIININNKYYPIDSTWGAGKWPLVKDFFYRYGFERYSPDEGMIDLNNTNEQKFVVYGNNMSKKTGLCNVYLLQGNVYQQLLNLSYINFFDDKFEVNCIFNKKGKYKIQIFGNNERGQENNMQILEYIVNVESDAKEELSFPTTYKGKEDINIIEPKYNNLKSGEKVKFKIKSNLEEIIIIDGQWHYLKKNEEGFFELETVIQSQKGNSVIIGKKKPPNSCEYLALYTIK